MPQLTLFYLLATLYVIGSVASFFSLREKGYFKEKDLSAWLIRRTLIFGAGVLAMVFIMHKDNS